MQQQTVGNASCLCLIYTVIIQPARCCEELNVTSQAPKLWASEVWAEFTFQVRQIPLKYMLSLWLVSSGM